MCIYGGGWFSYNKMDSFKSSPPSSRSGDCAISTTSPTTATAATLTSPFTPPQPLHLQASPSSAQPPVPQTSVSHLQQVSSPHPQTNQRHANSSSSSSSSSSTSSLQALQEWDFCSRLESCHPGLRALLNRHDRDTTSALGHLVAVHSEACNCCQNSSDSNEDSCVRNEKIWKSKKSAFVEACKLTGLSFEDFLSRVLSLILSNTMQNVEPVNEADLWIYLRQNSSYVPTTPTAQSDETSSCPQQPSTEVTMPTKPAPSSLVPPHSTIQPESATTTSVTSSAPPIDDEELADIQNYIMNDIVEANNVVATGQQHLAVNEFEADMSDELARLKRKEKHMAPIDCTGVSSAYGLTWHCRRCDRTHTCKSECRHYRGLHQPRHTVDNNPLRSDGLPPELVAKGKTY